MAEIKQVSENEFRIEGNKVFILENNIINVKAEGEQTDEIASAHLDLHNTLYSRIPGKLNYLIDLNNSGKNASEARKVWKQMAESETTDKVALFGIHPVARILATFVMGVTDKKDMRFFNTREEAESWLNA